MIEKKLPIVCLMGPTASGKTALAIALLRYFPFEIISVDSAMVYRGMDIGTAKPSAEILKIAPHRLIDICDPSEAYSAARFREDALLAIEDILSRQKIPLLVGGTMMYFRILQQGIAPMPSRDLALRERLTLEAEQLGWPMLHERLQEVDPVAAARIHPHDSQRIQRALEVFLLSGKNLTTWQEMHIDTTPHEWRYLILAPEDRAILHERIAKRFVDMLDAGLVNEVKGLFARPDLNLTLPSLRSVGYRQVWEYLQEKSTLAEMQEKGIIATRQLAKRQLTWLRSWPNATWFDSESQELVADVVAYLQSAFPTNHGSI